MKFRQLPDPLPDMLAWGCKIGRFSFVITLETTVPDDPEWQGYTASWKRALGNHRAIRIGDKPWQTFNAAEAACQATYRQLRNPQ